MNEKIISIIPARSGSKGVKNKNIFNLSGYPLIAYSIIASRLTDLIERTIVSTDSKLYANIAERYGAEVPFIRPKNISHSHSLDVDYIKHCLTWLDLEEGFQPEYIVILPPTVPLRNPNLISEAIKILIDNNEATSLRSGHEIRESPYKLFGINNGYFVGLFPNDSREEYYNLPRQTFPPVYQPNSYVDIIIVDDFKNTGLLHGKKILSFITPDNGEVDRIEDINFIKFKLKNSKNPIHKFLEKNYNKMDI